MPNAFPTIFPNLPKYFNKNIPSERRNPSERKEAALKINNERNEKWENEDKLPTFEHLCENYVAKLNTTFILHFKECDWCCDC